MRKGGRLAVIAALALFLRLAPAPFTGHGWDLYVWLKTSELFLTEQIDIYRYPQLEGFPWGFYAYPPPWLYLLAAARYLSILAGGDEYLSILLIKMPIIAADVLCGLVLWLTARRLGLGDEKSFQISVAYLLNPLTIFISGIWGMFDALPALFTLLSLHLLLLKRATASAFSLGLATVFKIYPVIILPSIILSLFKKGESRRVLMSYLLVFLVTLIIVSLPFLGDLNNYMDKLTYHRSNVGQFTYWTLLGIFIGGELSSTIGWLLFTVFLSILLYRQYVDERWRNSLPLMFASVFTLFLATSPKINIQYLVLGLPLLLLAAFSHDEEGVRKEVRRRLVTLHLAALIFIIGSVFIIGYDPSNMGKVYNLGIFEAGMAGFLILVAAGIAGWESVKLTFALNGLTAFKRRLDERAGVTVIIVIALIVVTVLPSPAGVRLPPQPIRVAVLESPDSLFHPGLTSIPPELYRNLAEPTHIVIPLSPDFYIMYPELRPSTEVSGHFRFRLDSGGWSLRDLSNLIKRLKISDVKVLAGVFTKSKDLLVSYGMQGYDSAWFRENSHLIGKDDRISFGIIMSQNLSLANFYAWRVANAVYSMGFDGVYVLTPSEGLMSVEDVRWIEPFLVELRASLDNSMKIFLDGVDPALGSQTIRALMLHVNYVVFRSPTWFREIASEEPRLGSEYTEQLSGVLADLSRDERLRILYSLNVMDFSSGWLVPALQVQLQVDTFSPLISEGFAIYYASRYLPYRLTLDSLQGGRAERG